jgi:hypothetical protein
MTINCNRTAHEIVILVHYLFNMLHLKMSRIYCCSCLVCFVVSCLVCFVVSCLVFIVVSCLVCIVVVVLCGLL